MPKNTDMSKNTEIPVFCPAGFPDYMAFRPESDTIELHGELLKQMEAFGRKLETSNHIQAHPLATQHIAPVLQLMYQWLVAAQRDQLIHNHHIAEYIADQMNRPDYIAEENVDKFDKFFDSLQALLGIIKPFLEKGLEGFAGEAEKLGEEGVKSLLVLAKNKAAEVEALMPQLADVIAEMAEPVDEEDEDDEEDDDDGGPEDEDVEGDAPPVRPNGADLFSVG